MCWVLLIGGFCAVWIWIGHCADKEHAQRPESKNYD